MLAAARFLRATLALALFAACTLPCSAETTNVRFRVAPYAALLRSYNPHLARAQSVVYAQTLLQSATRFHLDPALLVAVVFVESHWRPAALSPTGAEGLGQLKPATAQELGVDAWQGSKNLQGAALYLHRLFAFFAQSRQPAREAIAGYNAGPYAVRDNGGRPPNAESREYVMKVFHAWHAVHRRLPASVVLARVRPALLDDASASRLVDVMNANYWGASER